MKKNFKKSKFVILPALATLVLTGVASVTGTVAWFTANQAATFTAGSFKASTSDGNLTIAATPGTGTTKGSAAGEITVSATGMLDASYDGSKTYTNVDDTATGDAETYKEVNMASEVDGYFYAVSWKETVSVKLLGESATNTYNIFFDPKTSTATDANDSSTTKSGLRISMKCGTRRIVWAPFQTVEKTTTEAFVNGTANGSKGTYTQAAENKTSFADEIYAWGSDNTGSTNAGKWVYAQTTDANPNYRADYLGVTTTATGTSSVDVECVAWYEGLDEGITGAPTALSNITATIGFYARATK